MTKCTQSVGQRHDGGLAASELIELRAQLSQCGFKFGLPRFFLRDHIGWCTLNKRGVAEFGATLPDFGVETIDFFGESLALGGNIDFNLQH